METETTVDDGGGSHGKDSTGSRPSSRNTSREPPSGLARPAVVHRRRRGTRAKASLVTSARARPTRESLSTRGATWPTQQSAKHVGAQQSFADLHVPGSDSGSVSDSDSDSDSECVATISTFQVPIPVLTPVLIPAPVSDFDSDSDSDSACVATTPGCYSVWRAQE